MNVTPLRTPPIVVGDQLFDVIDAALTGLAERSVVTITSKIVAICEGSVVPVADVEKLELIHEQADLYLPPHHKYNINLTIKHNLLIASAGIDESNGNGYYILWPQQPQETANAIRVHLKERFGLNEVGVLIVDSKTTPLRMGVTGAALVYSGFSAVLDYVDKPDIFGRPFAFERSNVADGLAAASVLVMGEGAEQTPIAVTTDVPFIEFQPRDPSAEEIEQTSIALEDDLYSELLQSVEWRGKGAKAKTPAG